MKENKRQSGSACAGCTADVADFRDDYPKFTPAMKHTHKILVPDMLPVHFGIIVDFLRKDGWDIELLRNDSRAVIDEGLKHVHNDTCFPALCVTGQFIDALKSGKYDVEHTAVMITQSGGGCRASNYIPLIRKALKAEFPHVPVISLNFAGLEKDSGFPVNAKMLLKLAFAIFYGDTLMSLYNQCKPYEKEEGAADAAREECVRAINDAYDRGKYLHYMRITRGLLERFARVPRSGEQKVKVGIVGEIYVKYSPLGNSHLEEFLLSEGCEPVVPALMDFVMYCAVNNVNDAKLYNKKSIATPLFALVYRYLHHVQKKIIRLTEKYGFEPLHDFEHLRRCADKVLNQGVKMGEGWLIPAEMAALAETGTDNIVCAQPFGCLPNHIAGKGAVRTLKRMYEHENIVAVDYDPSATKVNQENRIKLMLATARENLAAAKAQAAVPFYCEKCHRLAEGDRCPGCGKHKVRRVQAEDFCLLAVVDRMLGSILEEALKSSGIDAVNEPFYTHATYAMAGNADSAKIYVRYGALAEAAALMGERFGVQPVRGVPVPADK